MNKYLIIKKIPTPLKMYEAIEYRGYNFSYSWEKPSNFVVVKKEVDGENYNEAYISFIEELVPVLEAISVLTQCIVDSLSMGSAFIYRLNNNQDKIMYAYLAKQTLPVGMDIEQEVFDDIDKMNDLEGSAAISYLRESNSAYTSCHRLSMLITAVEAIAGTGSKSGECSNCHFPYSYPSTDESRLKEILGNDLYKKVYGSIRHKLFHGSKVDDMLAAQLAGEMYDRIIFGYLKKEKGLNSIHEIKSAPRSFSFEFSGGFYKILDSFDSTLAKLENNSDDYECVGPVKDY